MDEAVMSHTAAEAAVYPERSASVRLGALERCVCGWDG